MIQLTRPLVFLDTETTGTSPDHHRVVQIGAVKYLPSGEVREWETLINPRCPIPVELTAIHGINDEMVRTAPAFEDIAAIFATAIKDCDLGGYNLNFDLRFLRQELERAGRKNGVCYLIAGVLDGRRVDAQRIFHTRERRSLVAAHERYLGRKLDGAHNALNDARASADVLFAQLEEYTDLPQTVEGLDTLLFGTPEPGDVDPEGKFVWRNGEACINFGVNTDKPLRKVDRGWLHWVARSNFSAEVKRIAAEALEGRFPQKEA